VSIKDTVFFPERAARSLPQNLLEEKDLTHFLGKKTASKMQWFV